MPQNENNLKNNPLKVPPQSNESEMAVLGSIMLKPDVMNDVLDLISKETFYSSRHRIIFENLMELFADGKPIDLLSVSEKLKSKDLLKLLLQ